MTCRTFLGLASRDRMKGGGYRYAEGLIGKFGKLAKASDNRCCLNKVKLELPNGTEGRLSRDKRNALQVAVVEEFGPRFAPGARLLFCGSATKDRVICATDQLATLRVGITEYEKLPDIVLYSPEKNWLFLIEAVTSHSPVNRKRRDELESMLAMCPAQRIYVTAIPERADFDKYLDDIAWETEVWFADTPDHMVHFNGRRPPEPYRR